MEDRIRRRIYRQYKHNSKHNFNYNSNQKRNVCMIMVILIVAVILLVSVFYQKKQEEKRKTIGNLLLTALKPVGSTMYIWGGGWEDEKTAQSATSVQIGVSPRWEEFYKQQDASYDFNLTRFQREDGLDCSGYLGWCVYNVMENKSGKKGYVVKSTCMALNYSKRGWGTFTEVGKVREFKAGDIMSMEGHVWMVVGRCKDGSVVFLHATPPGVSLAGTLLADGSESEATKLAESYMSRYFPDWYEKFPDCKKDYTYLTGSASMSWNQKTLRDREGLTQMDAKGVLEWMFSHRE